MTLRSEGGEGGRRLGVTARLDAGSSFPATSSERVVVVVPVVCDDQRGEGLSEEGVCSIVYKVEPNETIDLDLGCCPSRLICCILIKHRNPRQLPIESRCSADGRPGKQR